MDPAPLHRTIPARAEELAPLRHDVTEYARRVGVVDPFGVALALSETVSNAIIHAYRDEPAPGPVEVRAEPVNTTRHALRVTVVDHGHGMRPRTDSPGIGAGLPLVARVTEWFDICEAPDGGTQICMEFAVG